jgi:hypothetical protein
MTNQNQYHTKQGKPEIQSQEETQVSTFPPPFNAVRQEKDMKVMNRETGIQIIPICR